MIIITHDNDLEINIPNETYLHDEDNWRDLERQLARGYQFEGRVAVSLQLRSQRMSRRNWGRLFDAISKSTVERISFQRCWLNDRGAELFAEHVLGKSASLRRVVLWDCGVGPRGLKSIVRAIRENPYLPLESLELPRNPIGVVGGAHVSDLLTASKTLRFLNLKNCNVIGSQELVKGMQENYSVTEMVISGEEIGHEMLYEMKIRQFLDRNIKFLSIGALSWSPAMHCKFPPSFQDAVFTCLLVARAANTLPYPALVRELWIEIFQFVAASPKWFDIDGVLEGSPQQAHVQPEDPLPVAHRSNGVYLCSIL